MEALAILWVLGLVLYFAMTTPRQREDTLLVMWILLGGAAALPAIAWLL